MLNVGVIYTTGASQTLCPLLKQVQKAPVFKTFLTYEINVKSIKNLCTKITHFGRNQFLLALIKQKNKHLVSIEQYKKKESTLVARVV